MTDAHSQTKGSVRKNFSLLSTLFIIVFVCVIGIISYYLYVRDFAHSAVLSATTQELDNPTIRKQIQKKYVVAQPSSLTMTVQHAEVRKSFINDHEQINALPGKKFVLIHCMLSNQTDKVITVSLPKLFSLQTGNTFSQDIPPDVAPQSVTVPAKGTIFTRIGFVIDEKVPEVTVSVSSGNQARDTIQLSLQ